MAELVPRVVLEMVARGEARRTWPVLAIFADVSGFTAMTEQLARHGTEGAELLVEVLRDAFDPLLALVQQAGGQVTGFAGDAFTVVLPDDGTSAAVASALAVASGMREVFRRRPVRRTPRGEFTFGLKVGLCADLVTCEVVTVDRGRCVGYFHGPAIDRSAAAEHQAAHGDVVLTAEVAARAEGWSIEPRASSIRLGERADLDALDAPSVPSAGLRGEALFLPRAALGFPTEGEFREGVPVFFSFEGVDDVRGLVRRISLELRRCGDGALRVDFGDKGGVAWTFFGAPVALVDQVDQALDFACAVVAAGQGRVRAGVARGVVYAGFLGGRARAEFTCLGRPVNLAARLMMQASPGEVWCSPAVRERARRHTFASRGERSFKGFQAPIEALAVDGERLDEAGAPGLESAHHPIHRRVEAALAGQLASSEGGVEEQDALLVAWLDRLSLNVRRTVQVAAVLGPDLELSSLLALMNDQPRVHDYVRLASRARVWSHDQDGLVTFRSEVLRDAASRMLPRSRRRTLLRAAVDLFRRRGDARTTLTLLDQLVELIPDGAERLRLDAERQALRDRLDAEPAPG